MRRYYGAGYDNTGRPSPLAIVALAIACLAVGLSVFLLVGNDGTERRGITRPTPPAAPTPEIPRFTPSPEPTASSTTGPDTGTTGTTDGGTITPPRPPRDPRPVCRNSSNPSCGRFYWSPRPAQNKPLRLDVSYFPANPQPGETVTYTVTAKDGDAAIRQIGVTFGDRTSAGDFATCITPPRYGAWTPPAQKAGAKTVTFTHVYKAAGTYKAEFMAASGDCGSPYADSVTLPVSMVVATEAA